MSLEANELLDCFQWQDELFEGRENMAGELAVILIYAIQFADHYDIDIPTAIQQTIGKQAVKYPVGIFVIEDEDERNRAWLVVKQRYKKDITLSF